MEELGYLPFDHGDFCPGIAGSLLYSPFQQGPREPRLLPCWKCLEIQTQSCDEKY